MTFYKLPENHNKFIISDIKPIFSEETHSTILLSKSVYEYLMKSKEKTTHCKWNHYKKITNPYEYIYTPISSKSGSIAKYNPVSRSYFKLIEIFNQFNLDYFKLPINSFHIDESTSGFSEALHNLRNNYNDHQINMTLINKTNSAIPIFEYFKNKKITTNYFIGTDGDIMNHLNLKLLYDNHLSNTFDIITGDCGFDFSNNLYNQENLSTKLIISQVLYAIILQKKNGLFILKMFDIFTEISCDIIYFLTFFYNSVYISKPSCSRAANSEKYIICKFFKFSSTKHLIEDFISILKNKSCYLTKFLTGNIPVHFINKLEEINAIMVERQICYINNTINIINDNTPDKINKMIAKNINKCVTWCKKNNITINYNAI